MKVDIVVTRHSALVELAKELGMIDDNTPVITHVTDISAIEDKIVLGNLPLHLACHALLVITPEIETPPELRGKDMDLDTLKKYFKGFKKYKILALNDKEADAIADNGIYGYCAMYM